MWAVQLQQAGSAARSVGFDLELASNRDSTESQPSRHAIEGAVKITILIGLAIIALLLVVFHDTPLVSAMGAFVTALGRLFLAIFNLLAKLVTSV